LDLEAINFLGPVPHELIQGFEDRKTCRLEASLNGLLVALEVFPVDESAQILLVVPVLAGGLGSPLGVVSLEEGQQQILELLV
jgi:hypothetical protein